MSGAGQQSAGEIGIASPTVRYAGGASALFILYIVIFVGFIGYSLMITVFTPMLLDAKSAIVAASTPTAHRTILLGILLCLYPLGQFLGSPIVGALSDRFGRKPVLMISLAATTFWYVVIAIALDATSLTLLCVASFFAGLSEANIVAAQSAISDVIGAEDRNRYFGYIYMSVSSAYIVGPLVGGKLQIDRLRAGSATRRHSGWSSDY